MKKLFAVLLALMMLLLPACGCADTNTTTTTTTTTTTDATTEGTTLPTLDDLPDVTVTVMDKTEESEGDTTTEGSVTTTTTEGVTTTEGTTTTTTAVVEMPTTTVTKPAIPTAPSTTTTKKTTTATTTTTKKPTTTEKTTTTTKQTPSATTTKKPTTTTTKKPTTTTTTTKPTNPTYAYTTNQKHVAVPYTQRYHYNLLDKPLQEVYDLIVKAVDNLEARTETFVLDDKYEDSFRKVFTAFRLDNPEYFYVAQYHGVMNYGNNKHHFDILYSVANYNEDPTGSNRLFEGDLSEELKSRIRAKKATFDAEVQRIISTIPVNAPDVVKEQMAYESILKACHYNMQAVTDYLWDGHCDDNWTAYGIMVNKKGVCESYSEAFQTLCLQMGINCITVTGSVSSGGHMWNAVQLDDGWYMCDITFDDPVGGGAGTARYDYFNRTSLWMQEHFNHTWQYSNDFTIPKCTKTKYAYEEYFGGSVYEDAWN